MSELRVGLDYPFSGHGENLVNVKFFRGTRNDIISAAEIRHQASLAATQFKIGGADVSDRAPVSKHSVVNVADFVSQL